MRAFSPYPIDGKLGLVIGAGSGSNAVEGEAVSSFNATRLGFEHLVASGGVVINVGATTLVADGDSSSSARDQSSI